MYEVIECRPGVESLRRTLAQINAQGKTVVSVVNDHGNSFTSVMGSGMVMGFLIVVRVESEDDAKH